jgi:hypothetical protein
MPLGGQQVIKQTLAFWRSWLEWMDRDIAGTWPFLNGPSTFICLFPLLLNVIFAIIKVSEPVRLGFLNFTAITSCACLAIWVWRAGRYFFYKRLPEIRSRRNRR